MPRARPRDHLGNRYPTVRDMCRAYGISTATFYTALEDGATLEEALRSDKRKFYKYQTHLFTCREGLMAYAGVSRWEDIADKVRVISAAEAIKRRHLK